MTDTTDPIGQPASTESQPNTEAPPTPAQSSESFAIPESYKDRGWTQNLKSQDDVWKMLDNAQTIVGKRVVPDFEKGDPKEIESFLSQLKPKDKGVYQMPDTVPEGEREAWSNLLHEAGLPAPIANKLVPKFIEHVQAQAAKDYDRDAFFSQAEKTMGAGYKEEIAKASQAVKGLLPKDMQDKIDALPNDQYIAFISGLKTVMSKYGATETGSGGEGGEGNAVINVAEEGKRLRGEIAKLTSRSHTAEEKNKLIEQLDNLYKGVRA